MDDAMITIGILTVVISITLIMLVINASQINRLTKRIDSYDKELITLKDEVYQLKMASRFGFPLKKPTITR